MHLPFLKQKIMHRYLGLLIFNILAMWFWALINIYLQQTRLWTDVLWGIFIVVITTILSPHYLNLCQYQKKMRFMTGILILIAMGLGGIYIFSEQNESLAWVVEPLLFLLSTPMDARSLTFTQTWDLTRIYIILGSAVILVSTLLKNAYHSEYLSKIIQNKLDRIRVILRWRSNRVIMFFVRAILLTIIGVFVSIGLAMIRNTLESKNTFVQTHTFSGPNAPLQIFAILVDYQNDTLFAGTEAGVFRSHDGGQSWEAASTGLTSINITILLQDSHNGALYAGTSFSIFRSIDGGKTWQDISGGLPKTVINTLTQSNHDGTLYVGTLSGAFRSTDGGHTWEESSIGLTNNEFITFLLQDSCDDILYAGLQDGVFRSNDNGQTWETTGLTNTFVKTLEQDIRDCTLYAGTESSIFRSTDHGQTWEDVSAGLTSTTLNILLHSIRDSTLFAGTESGVFRSEDGGQTWSVRNTGLTNTIVNTLVQNYRDGTLFVGTASGVFRSTDGGKTWDVTSEGLTSTSVNTLLKDGRSGALYSGTGAGVFRSTDDGQTWDAASVGLTNTHISDLLQDHRDGTLYAATGGGVFRSNNGGQTWDSASQGLTNTSISSLFQDHRDNTLYAGTVDGVFRSNNRGQTWRTSVLQNKMILALSQDERDGTLYAATDAFFQDNERFFRSIDGGQTWDTTGAELGNTSIITLLQDSQNGTFYAGTSNGILYSNDSGQTWKSATEGLSDTIVYALLQDGQGTLYAGTDKGIFHSKNGDQIWEAVNEGLTNTIVLTLLQDSGNGTLYAGTSNGVFCSNDSGQTWKAISMGLTNTSLNTVLLDNQNETLYVGTQSGVYLSSDSGQTWDATSLGLTNLIINTLLQDDQDGTLYAGTTSGIFHYNEEDQSWKIVDSVNLENKNIIFLTTSDGVSYAGLVDFWGDGSVFKSSDNGQTWGSVNTESGMKILQDNHAGILYFQIGSTLLFRSTDTGGRIGQRVGFTDYYSAYENMPEWVLYESIAGRRPNWFLDNPITSVLEYYKHGTKDKHYYVFGATVFEINTSLETASIFCPFWALCTWTELWFKDRWFYFFGFFGLTLLLWGLVDFGRAAWSLKIPFLQLLQNKKNIFDIPVQYPIMPTIQRWHDQIHNEIVEYGDANPDDLVNIPVFLRGSVINSYYRRYQTEIAIQPNRHSLALIAGNPFREWRAAWRSAGNDFRQNEGLSAKGYEQIKRLAQSLCDVLGFRLAEIRTTPLICAWQVQAPALRLNLPQRFPLIFLATPRSNAETVRQLFDVVSAFNGTSNFSLVIPLEMPNPDADPPQVLRRLVNASPYAHDFIVISNQDVIEILIARHPERILVKHISRQVDLSFISPFVVNGPVPPQMFFGRDKEIRTLVDYAGKRNFAVIGNRKVGKTSLLNQVDFRLSEPGNVRLLRMDCQAIRDSAEFLGAFQKSFIPDENIVTPSVLAGSLRAMKKQSAQPLVLMLDEVDALLATEKASGESFLAVWRELANEHTCAFIFCGSKILVRQLRDPESALFNFPETLSLTCLNRSEMDEVITRPLETLGIGLQDAGAVLDSAWALTSGHPNLTQFVGRALVNAANENPERLVGPQAVEDTSVDPDFIKFYFDTVWGAATPLEKCITLLMPPDNFSVGDVEQALADAGIPATPDEVDAALDTLQAYAVLGRSGKLYHFIPRAFHQLLEANYEKERLLAREKSKLNGDGA